MPNAATLNPLKWKHEDRVRLLFAAGFGALVGFTTDYFREDVWFNILCALVGAVLVAGAFYCYRFPQKPNFPAATYHC